MRERLIESQGELLFSGMPSRLPTRQGIAHYMCQLGLESSRKGIRIFETRDSALEWMEDPLLDSVVCDRAFPAGQALFSRGDSGDEIFFVRRGRVEVLLPLDGEKYHHLATFCQGDFFGEMAFLDREPRNAIVRAVIATDLYVLSRERFDRDRKSTRLNSSH